MSITAVSRPFVIATALASVAVGVSGYAWQQSLRLEVLEIYFFALKGGQAIFIRTPSDRRILFDGGANSEIVRHLSSVIPFHSRRIDMLIAGNTSEKSVSGLIDVLERYVIERIYIPAITLGSLGLASSTERAYEVFLSELRRQNVSTQEVLAGDNIVLDSVAKDFPVTADILFPISPDIFDYSKASAPEVVMNISYGSTAVMIIGNASRKIQNHIASSSVRGTASSTAIVLSHSAILANISARLMDFVHPEFVIYSRPVVPSQKNNALLAKKPSPDPLTGIGKEKRFNVRETGAVKIISDGKRITVENIR